MVSSGSGVRGRRVGELLDCSLVARQQALCIYVMNGAALAREQSQGQVLIAAPYNTYEVRL